MTRCRAALAAFYADHAENLDLNGIDWVIASGESGQATEPCAWSTRGRCAIQCVAASVPFFFKQHGGPRPQSGGRVLDGRTSDKTPHVPAAEAVAAKP